MKGRGLDETAGSRFQLVDIRLPVALTFGALIAGLLAGALMANALFVDSILAVTDIAGSLWLRALQMCIIPLVASLLVLGIVQLAGAAAAGAAARRMLALMLAVLVFSGLAAVIGLPALLKLFPVPEAASAFLNGMPAQEQTVPAIGEFLKSLVAPNLVAAAAETAMLPLTVFFALFALAITRLPTAQADALLAFFHAIANAMLVLIGWVLWVAPVGVFALAFGVAVSAGGGAFAALLHYIVSVSAIGAVILIMAYGVAFIAGRVSPVRFARALISTQAIALSTQSSLASLPAMLDSAGRLGLRQRTSEFVLPLAVAIFRATSPAMNLAVAIYIAHLAGVPLTPTVMAAGIAVAIIISIGSVSLPGSISFVVSIGPIAIAMGVPVEPLAILVAVEMLPDIMRTLGNVTMNLAIAAAVDQVDREPSNAA